MNKKIYLNFNLHSDQHFIVNKVWPICMLMFTWRAHFTGEVVKGDVNNLPVYIEADKAEINQPTQAIYQGNVDLKQGNRHLVGNSVEVKQTGEGKQVQRWAYLRGGFDYKDNQINLLGNDASFNLDSKNGNVTDANYQLVGRQGRGKAQEIELGDNYRLMKNATFTSCLPDDNAWAVDASEIRQHIKEEYAEFWHARFKVLGVPVFYTPYLQLPIGDRRRSGLLMPTVGHSSRDGYWYKQPIYWNIAPNYDATIAPKYMSRRGWQLNGEFRYLTPVGEGKFAGEYLGLIVMINTPAIAVSVIYSIGITVLLFLKTGV